MNRLCWVKAASHVLLESALKDCREAIHVDPTYNAVIDREAMVLLKLGKLNDALVEYDKAVANKSGAEALMGRAIVRAPLGDSAGANADPSEAHKLRPDIDDEVAEYGLKFDHPQPTRDKIIAAAKTAK